MSPAKKKSPRRIITYDELELRELYEAVAHYAESKLLVIDARVAMFDEVERSMKKYRATHKEVGKVIGLSPNSVSQTLALHRRLKAEAKAKPKDAAALPPRDPAGGRARARQRATGEAND